MTLPNLHPTNVAVPIPRGDSIVAGWTPEALTELSAAVAGRLTADLVRAQPEAFRAALLDGAVRAEFARLIRDVLKLDADEITTPRRLRKYARRARRAPDAV